MTGALIRRGKLGHRDTKTHTEGKMPHEDGVIQDCQGLPVTNKSYEEAKKDSSIKSLEEG